MKKILIVAGTRPNFIKITRFRDENRRLDRPFDMRIVHTGQHYDEKMATVFFRQFDMEPDYFLEAPPASPTTQMAEIMTRLEKVLTGWHPDLVMVPGDVNSTLAAALACNKTGVQLAHIESGLRSFDRTMPEEFNRILTDDLADWLFVTEQSGKDNLLREGKDERRIFFTGNTMIDTLVAYDDRIQNDPIDAALQVQRGGFILVTMHRPATVDDDAGLGRLLEVLDLLGRTLPVVFPVHPRTRKKLEEHGLLAGLQAKRAVVMTDPMDYFAFQKLIAWSRFVVTDSGGIQEETTFRGIPCLTLRPGTERPVTVDTGTNELVPFDTRHIAGRIEAIMNGTFKKGGIPPLWDGRATQRILACCDRILYA